MFKITLKAARVNANLTIKDVADKTGKTEKTVHNRENGKTAINLNDFYMLCKLYNINSDYVQVPEEEEPIFFEE